MTSRPKNPADGLWEEFVASEGEDNDPRTAFFCGVATGLAKAKELFQSTQRQIAPADWVDIMGKLTIAIAVASERKPGEPDNAEAAGRLMAFHAEKMREYRRPDNEPH